MTEGAKAMESLKSVTHVIMDKTGTLTEGKLRVSYMKTSAAWKERVQTLCTLICAAEEHGASAHPIGAAVFRETLRLAEDRWSQYKSRGSLKDLREVAGQGVECQVNLGDGKWRSICVGSLELLKTNGISDYGSLQQDAGSLGSFCFVAVNGELAASLVLRVIPTAQCSKLHHS